jgi:ABC-type Fe3+-hydroxamate transport system substrate-binding protein/membrane protein required for beta-lactamase induction
MTLIALLIGLIIERLATQIFHWRRMRWLDRIIDKGFSLSARVANWPALIPVIVLIVALALPVAAVTIVLVDRLFGFPHLILAVVVLFFSLGPNDIGEEVNEYCSALEDGDDERIDQTARALVENALPDDPLERIRCVEEAVCIQANNRLFAVIFWFVLLGPLGPLGAWAYRVTDLVRRRAVFQTGRDESGASLMEPLRDAAVAVHGWLAWIPARLTAIGYAVAGHFDAALAAWRTGSDAPVGTTSENSERLLARVGAWGTWRDRGQAAGIQVAADMGRYHRGDDLVRLDRVRRAPLTFLIATLPTFFACDNSGTPETPADAAHSSRIVSLAPNLAELVFAAGAGDTLVGVSAYSDYPPTVEALPLVGDAFTIDQERLAMLRPDLLLAWQSGTPAHVVDELRQAGYEVEVLRTRSLDDIAAALVRIGTLAGTQQKAREVATEFSAALQELGDAYADAEPIRVFYQVSSRPLYTVGHEHFASELIALCGGRNVFADLDELAPAIDVEAVIDRNPEVMLAGDDAGSSAFAEWDRWPAIAANRYGNRYLLPGDELSRPTTRVLVAGEAICEALQSARAKRRDSETRSDS